MKKHLLRIALLYTGFELFRELGNALHGWLRNEFNFHGLFDRHALLLRLSGYVVFMLYALGSFLLLEKFFRTRKRIIPLAWIAMVFVITNLRYVIEEMMYPYFFGFHNYSESTPMGYYYTDNVYFAFLYSSFGIIYFFINNERQVRLQQVQLQVENKEIQLAFLQSQINPHFLFNSLNNIYSLVYRGSDKALPAIAGLSELLRYTLYDNEKKVTVDQELSYIRRFVEQQQLRYEVPVRFEEHIDAGAGMLMIPPLLLVPFVENAFKHGDLSAPVQMYIAHDPAGGFRFTMVNKIGHQLRDKAGGIGLVNVRRRLDLLYPGLYDLQAGARGDQFIIALHLTNA